MGSLCVPRRRNGSSFILEGGASDNQGLKAAAQKDPTDKEEGTNLSPSTAEF
jgi:hypothetical protein